MTNVEGEKTVFKTLPFYAVPPGKVFRRSSVAYPCVKLAVWRKEYETVMNAELLSEPGKGVRIGEMVECILCDEDGTPERSNTGKELLVFDPDKAVREFHRHFNVNMNTKPQWLDEQDVDRGHACFMEEVGEYFTAVANQDFVAMADALADMGFTIYGLASRYGIKLSPLIREVHRSNMTKTPAASTGGKVQKGKGYVPPDVKWELVEQGWAGGNEK